MTKIKKQRTRMNTSTTKIKSSAKFDILHEDPMRGVNFNPNNIQQNIVLPPKHKSNKNQISLLAYFAVAIATLIILAAILHNQLNKNTLTDLTDASTIRTVKLAEKVPAADVCDAMIDIAQDDKKRPIIKLKLTPKNEETYDIRLKVDAIIQGTTNEGDDYEQTLSSLVCDTTDKGVFSRDGYVYIQNFNATRDILLYPNFTNTTIKGTVKKLKHIDVNVLDAQPSASVIDSLTPDMCSITAHLEDDGNNMRISGSVQNPCDRPMKNVRVHLGTRSLSGGTSLPTNRDDIPWAYGAQTIYVPIGDLGIGQTVHVNQTLDVSKLDITMAYPIAVVADANNNQ